MLIVNVDLQDRLVNGQLGIVKHIKNELKICVKFDDWKAGLEKMITDAIGKQHLWVPIEKREVDIRIKSNKDSSLFIKRTEFPMILAWACTVHKAQCSSVRQIIINFQLLKQRNFDYGQIYVALSRVTSLKQLFILDSFRVKTVRSNPQFIKTYNRMRCESKLVVNNVNSPEKNELMITSLNIRSLNKHAVDLG